MTYFSEVKKNFGFGCMRLPMKENKIIDYEEFSRMVDLFLESGFNYFDTAHGYVYSKSEEALCKCLTSRYPREKYILTDKLSESYFNKEEEIRPFFEKQLKICGVDYFDFYLMHAQNSKNFPKYKACRAYETAFELKKEGKIRHVGLSFHDTADVLEQILTEYPQIEAVQLQFNYLDYESSRVQSRKCYEVCQKHGKPVIIMEPVKGGRLANLPKIAQGIFKDLDEKASPASYALRFAAGFENVFMVLSGMSNMEQMNDNVSFMKDFKPLCDKETDAVKKVTDILTIQGLIPCTACRYCVDGCPKKISIPDIFDCANSKKQSSDYDSDYYYNQVYTKNNGKASDCIKCGKCEQICPQHLEIRRLLSEVAEQLEKN